VRATDNILPEALLDRVTEEVLIFEKYEREERAKSVQGGAVSISQPMSGLGPVFLQISTIFTCMET
jgi:hypothetical protein